MLSTLGPVVQVLLTLVSGLLPSLGVNGTSVVSQIISGLEQILPVIIKEGGQLYAEVDDIITALRNGATPLTPAQLTTLDQLDAQLDAAFEADAAAAGAQADPAAS